jgi:hypothetical protein
VTYIRDLLDEVRRGDPIAADELVDFVENALEQPGRRVGVAFGLYRRGGEQPQHAATRQVRDRAYRAIAPRDVPLREQVKIVARKRARYRPDPKDAESSNERRWLWEIHQSGHGEIGPRQLGRILERP